jgi:hypothetical protein
VIKMNREQELYFKYLKDFMEGSLDTSNLITMFWVALREGGVYVPELRQVIIIPTKLRGRIRRERMG